MPVSIYIGTWIDWTRGPVFGATLTLNERHGGLLIAFIAAFVTIVAAQFWKILTFVIHQIRCSLAPQDGLYHQQQIVFRNSQTPGGALWISIQQTWYWWNKARHASVRTLPWALFAAIYICGFGAITIFSTEISNVPGNVRLVDGSACGYWYQDPSEIDGIIRLIAQQQKMANDSLSAERYVRTCYNGGNPELCARFAVAFLPSIRQMNVSCPWQDMCLEGDTAAYQVRSNMIDSHDDLGINTEPAHRISLRYSLTCAPLRQSQYRRLTNLTINSAIGTVGDRVAYFDYGPKVSVNGTVVQNFTHVYNRNSAIMHGYDLNSDMYSPDLGTDVGSSGSFRWRAIPALIRNDSETVLLFLTANQIGYREPVQDPFFRATLYAAGYDRYGAYRPNNWVNVMGCMQTYQFCQPGTTEAQADGDDRGRCTSPGTLNTLRQDVAKGNFNTQQLAITRKLTWSLIAASLNVHVQSRGTSILKAAASVVQFTQPYLPPNQWMLEVDDWFDVGLASLQQSVLQLVTGPTDITPGLVVRPPINTAERALCYRQITRETNGTISFSILGLALLFTLGLLVVLTSMVLDTFVGWVQKRTGKGLHARLSWILDDKLQLHSRLSNAMAGEILTSPSSSMLRWQENEAVVPTTLTSSKEGRATNTSLSLAAMKMSNMTSNTRQRTAPTVHGQPEYMALPLTSNEKGISVVEKQSLIPRKPVATQL